MVELKNLSKIYGKGETAIVALDGVSYTFNEGRFYAIVGESGTGKSTLLNMIGALDKPTEGRVLFNETDIFTMKDAAIAAYRNNTVGYVFQSFYLEPTYSVADNVALPLLIAGVTRKERANRVIAALEKFGVADLAEKKAKDLSGGQKQRVSLARAIVSNPEIILADEPTGNLDSMNGRDVVRMLKSLAEEGKTVIMVTHNIEDSLYADVIAELSRGKLIDRK